MILPEDDKPLQEIWNFIRNPEVSIDCSRPSMINIYEKIDLMTEPLSFLYRRNQCCNARRKKG
jgi:hypothetical protein